MVLLGGLEFLAAGILLNEINKDGHKSPQKKHKNRRDSSGRPSRPSQSQNSLQPPFSGPQRPTSAPPPQSRPQFSTPPPSHAPQQQNPLRPNQQSQPPFQQQQQQQQQQWRPIPTSQQHPPPQQQWPLYPQSQAPLSHPAYPPPQYSAIPPTQSQPHVPLAASYYNQTPNPPSHQRERWPPDGWYYDMKTGKLQPNMLPQEMPSSSQSRSVSGDPLAYGKDYSEDRGRPRSHGQQHERMRSWSRHRPI